MEIKINKWDLIKLKSFCTSKETVNTVIKQPSEWKNIIANEKTGEGLISKIYKQIIQFNNRKKKKNNQKAGKRHKNRHFSKEDTRMTNKHMKRCSTLLIIREMKIKTTISYNLTPVRMAVIKQSIHKQQMLKWV